MSAAGEMRTVRLGGVTAGRGVLGGVGNELEKAALALVVVAALVLLFTVGASWWSLLTAVVLVLAGAVVLLPWQLTGSRSIASRWAGRWWFTHRARAGRTNFEAGTVATRTAGLRRGRASTTVRDVPECVGRVQPLTVTGPSGEPVLVLIHRSSGSGFVTVTLDVESAGGGLQSQEMFDAEYARWGRFKAALARTDSLVGGLQQLERVQPPSLAAHEAWLASRVNYERVHPLVLESYGDLVGRVEWQAEAHRSLLVLVMPMNATWHTRTQAAFGDSSEISCARMAAREAGRVARLATSSGGMRSVTLMSEAHVAAAVRAMLDADHSMSDVRRSSLRSCWLPWQAHWGHVQVGAWQLRTAQFPVRDMPGEPVPVDILRALCTGVYPTVVRTVACIEHFTPAAAARAQAKSDATIDTGKLAGSAGRVTDGSEHVQLSATQQRLVDLRAGTGHHGSEYSLHVTVAGRDEAQLRDACDRLAEVAGELALPLTWLDGAHEQGLAATLPLGRGLRPSKSGLRRWRS